MNPHFWVFCEGQTEEAYARLLRTIYKVPVEIITKIAGSKISSRLIASFKKGKPTHEKDKTFLVYDADVQDILDKLGQIKGAITIISNPCVELWFLLHLRAQTASISSEDCVRALEEQARYKKGTLEAPLRNLLETEKAAACQRSRSLRASGNPSTNLHVLVEALESARE